MNDTQYKRLLCVPGAKNKLKISAGAYMLALIDSAHKRLMETGLKKTYEGITMLGGECI